MNAPILQSIELNSVVMSHPPLITINYLEECSDTALTLRQNAQLAILT